ncbi:MAG: DUF87 domain-containing protein [Candidatus Abawacabacteria bacterium]|nr:DUF87 domain-containing protein [Candidatus Abawacabacteria bacterium]
MTKSERKGRGVLEKRFSFLNRGAAAPDAEKKSSEQKRLDEAQKLYEAGLASVKDLIAPSSMKVDYDKLMINDVYARTYVVFSYPRYLDTNWLSPVINLEATMDISMFIYPIQSADILHSLQNKVGQMESAIRIQQERGQARDPALEAALADAEELRDRISTGIEKFFQFGLYFTIYTNSEKQLTNLGKQLEAILGGKLLVIKSIQARTEQAFHSTMPYATDELYVVRNMNTEPLSSSFPFTSSELTSDQGILYGINRHNNSLIIFDRFSLPNANSVVFATSGAGKSYAVKLEVLRSLMLGTDVIVIDPENEYKALCDMVGGTYMDVSLNADRRINPFDLPLPYEGKEEQPGDLLRTAIITLKGLMKLMLGNLSAREEGLMDQALLDTYALKGITMDTVNPGTIPPPTMEDLYDVLQDTKGGEDLAQRLKQYTAGIFAGIFNRLTNVDLKSGLVVFSIRDLDEVLRPTAMYIILNYIWNMVRSKLKRRLLVIDEAWTMVQHDDAARFVYGLVKRARKYYLGVTNITQDVEDFLAKDFGKSIITNSAMQILLKQAPSAVPGLSKIFNLTEGEQYYLLNSVQGEGIFFAGRKHVAIQVIASAAEHRVITTNPEELLQMRTQAENFDTK